MAYRRNDARSVKSTGWPPAGIVNVAITGSNVPHGKFGIVTFAFVELTTEKLCSPGPPLATSTVTEFGPAVIELNAFTLPGINSVTVSDGVQTPGFGVGVGVGVTVGVAVGVGVGPPPPGAWTATVIGAPVL